MPEVLETCSDISALTLFSLPVSLLLLLGLCSSLVQCASENCIHYCDRLHNYTVVRWYDDPDASLEAVPTTSPAVGKVASTYLWDYISIAATFRSQSRR